MRQKPSMNSWLILVCLWVTLFVGCGSDQFSPNTGMEPVPVGPWGGNGISLEVGFTDSTVEFDCATGTIDEAFIVDRNGEFNLQGTFTLGQFGPDPFPPEPEVPEVARYIGTVAGDTMTLIVTRTDAGLKNGPFTLEFEKPSRLFKCL